MTDLDPSSAILLALVMGTISIALHALLIRNLWKQNTHFATMKMIRWCLSLVVTTGMLVLFPLALGGIIN